MSTMDTNELAFYIGTTPKPDQDEDAMDREANRIVEGIKAEYLHRDNTPEMRRELQKRSATPLVSCPD